MNVGTLKSPRRRSVLEQGQVVLLALLVLLTVVAWTLTVHQARTMDMPMGIVARGAVESDPPAADPDAMSDMSDMEMEEPAGTDVGTAAATGMSGMDDDRWAWDGFSSFLVAWAVMMVAMMFPAVAPLVLIFRTISAQRATAGRAFAPTWIFIAGYLVVWTTIGALSWVLVQLGSDLAGRIGDADRGTWAPLALGATLAVAGVYQFTPLKKVCLHQCQSPFSFVMTRWREGRWGAFRMGFVHGAYCLGCCWALFAVLVAAGVMSLAWMLLLTLVVFAEKVLPVGRWGPRVVGAAFLLLGLVVAAGATDMPWVA
jgi:predicted metal-binding membrane protein